MRFVQSLSVVLMVMAGFQVAHGERRAEVAKARYEQMLARKPGGLAGEVQLARWCERNRLEEQSREHWLRTLCFDPRHKRALKALELEALFEPSGDDIEVRDRQQRSLRMLGALCEPAANFVLAWHTLNSPHPEVRQEALEQLRAKPLPNYVPMLLAGLSMPLDMSVQTTRLGNRMVSYYAIEQEGPGGTYSQQNYSASRTIPVPQYTPTAQAVLTSRFVPEHTARNQCGTERLIPAHTQTTLGIRLRYGPNPQFFAAQQRAYQRAGQDAGATQAQLDQSNRFILQQNAQIISLLRDTTDAQLDDDPRSWWNWWQDYSRVRGTQSDEAPKQ